MASIRSMVVAGLLVSVVGFSGCGGNKSSGNPGDGSARDGGSAGAGGGGTAGAGGSAGGGGTAGVGGGGTAGAGGSAGTGPVPISCDGVTGIAQCNDGVDNGDDDTLIDSADPECQGPCDNDEGSFATGIPGDNIDACKQDCFFDGNSGQGDDGCNWNLKCDPAGPGGTSCPYVAGTQNCGPEQSPKCIKNCQKLAPNGCDCFGCCAVTANDQPVNLMLVGTCTAAKFGDPVACPRCTQNTTCLNTCGPCEVCVGRPAPDPSCTTPPPVDGGTTDASTPPTDAGGMSMQCPTGATACNAGAPCTTSGYYCQTGCCVQFTVE